MGRASRRRRRDTYSRRRHEMRERPGFAEPDDWPPAEVDDRDERARRQAEYDDLSPELPPPWWAQP